MLARPHRDDPEKVETERAKRQAEIDERFTSLSAVERGFMETRLQRRDEGDLAGLHMVAFHLLAGTKLARFSDALVNWAFANALNPSIHTPYRDFAQLISLNAVDWGETREALLRAAAPLMHPGLSETGQWALVMILRATGHPDDAARAEEIANELTKDRPRFPGWRRVEEYCATDPCDPASYAPGNITKTATAYEAIDVASLRQGRGASANDHFFSDAMPGLARFVPTAALRTLQRLAHHVFERESLARRQGVLELRSSSAALDSGSVDRLLAIARTAPGDPSDAREDDRDKWIVGQYSLFIALPHKSGNEQLAILASLTGRSLLLPMLEQLSTADEATTEEHLERAIQSTDPDAKARVLAFIHYSRSPLSARSRQRVIGLLCSPDTYVRTLVLGIPHACAIPLFLNPSLIAVGMPPISAPIRAIMNAGTVHRPCSPPPRPV
jgi:hypothetical protein